MSKYQLHIGDCLAILPTLPDNSVDLILTDPPYYKVKGDAWDRQWATATEYLAWLDKVLIEFARVLRPSGSLYLFASPQMAARVECLVGTRFAVINRITWQKDKDRGKHAATCKADLRSFFPNSEAIIFAEHLGADNIAKGEAGYGAKCDELRGFIFEPLRKYLEDARKAAGIDKIAINVACGFSASPGGMASRHYFSRSQWRLPTEDHYLAIQRLAPTHFTRTYEDLRIQYEDLRIQYESLRRPFQVTADVPYTDVWDFPTVAHHKGKHPCEKPQDLLRHIITASSRPDAVVLDAFMGSGSTGKAALALGRSFIGIELDPTWIAKVTTELEKSP
jgi:site-specific DNA-methyltransferase (adenine-specific)